MSLEYHDFNTTLTRTVMAGDKVMSVEIELIGQDAIYGGRLLERKVIIANVIGEVCPKLALQVSRAAQFFNFDLVDQLITVHLESL